MENSHRCEICKTNVHRASYGQHLRIEKHLENEKQLEMIIPEWLIQESIGKKFKIICNPKALKQIARNNKKLEEKQLVEELVKKLINPYWSSDRALQVSFNITLDSDHINQSDSKLSN